MSANTIIWMMTCASGLGLILRVIELFSKRNEPETWATRYVFDTAMQIAMFTWGAGYLAWGLL